MKDRINEIIAAAKDAKARAEQEPSKTTKDRINEILVAAKDAKARAEQMSFAACKINTDEAWEQADDASEAARRAIMAAEIAEYDYNRGLPDLAEIGISLALAAIETVNLADSEYPPCFPAENLMSVLQYALVAATEQRWNIASKFIEDAAIMARGLYDD